MRPHLAVRRPRAWTRQGAGHDASWLPSGAGAAAIEPLARDAAPYRTAYRGWGSASRSSRAARMLRITPHTFAPDAEAEDRLRRFLLPSALL